jgi:hypothetical protein
MSNKNIQQKSANKSTKSKRRKNKNNNNTVLKQGGIIRSSSTAASYEVAIENPTKFEITGKGMTHSEYGTALRVVGMQQLTTVTTTGDDFDLFIGGLATLVSPNLVQIAPASLNDRIALVSSLYQRYAFRNIEFVYVTRVPTTQAGCFALAYTTDGGYGLAAGDEPTPSYSGTQDIEPCKVIPFRKETECLSMSYSGERTWYVDLTNVGTLEGWRQCYQGVLVGFPDITSIGAVQQGEIYIKYVLDLYVPNQIATSVTLFNRLEKGLKQELVKFLKKLSLSTKVEKEVLSAKFIKLLSQV